MADNRNNLAPDQGGSGESTGRAAGGRYAPGISGNRDGRPRKSSKSERSDGWYSLLTGLGTAGRDKRESVQFTVDPVDWMTAEGIWRGDDLASRIIETLPNEMMREGYDLCITDDDTDDGEGPDEDEPIGAGAGKARLPTTKNDVEPARSAGIHPDLKKEVEHRWEELGLFDAIHEALCYERAYGGAAILVGAQDRATNLEEPLAIADVQSVDFLTVMEPREVQPVLWYGDPRAKKFGRAAVYQLTPTTPGNTVDRKSHGTTVRIHESRLIVFGGIRVTRRLVNTNGGWGDSILTRVYRILRDYNLSWGAAGTLITDFAQAVYKMKGLNELLQDDGKDVFKNRMIGMEMARSVARATMIDSEDDFTRVVTPIAGLPEMLDRFTQRLCMAARLPLPLLASESPSGLNASGASGDQLRMFYDSAKSEQKRKVVPVIRRVTSLIMQALGGEPAQWTIEPRALWQPTQKEQIETRAVQSKIDCDYLDRGVNTPEEIRESRYGGKSFGFDTRLIISDMAQPSAADVDAFVSERRVAAPAGQPEVTAPPIARAVPDNAPTAVIGPAPTAGTDIQKQAMNGAQIDAMLQVVGAVNEKTISRQSGIAALRIGFQLSQQDALDLLGPEAFEPAKPVPTAFGGAPFGAPAPALDKPLAAKDEPPKVEE